MSTGRRMPDSRVRRRSVRTASVQDYFKRRARNWRARRLRVNALALRPGRSRFAACVRRFAARGCVRGGLSRWASGMLGPRCWPTVAGVLADCLSAHRETSRPNLSLVHSSRGRNARTHKQPSPVGAKSRGQSARKRRTLVMAAEREGWRQASSKDLRNIRSFRRFPDRTNAAKNGDATRGRVSLARSSTDRRIRGTPHTLVERAAP
jgi:hypothetical protein